MSKKRVMLIADVPNWAWAKKSEQLKKHLGGSNGEFEIAITFTTNSPPEEGYDLYHTYEVVQTTQLPVGWLKTTGITAHVWPTWNARHGANTVKGWASTAKAIHANSVLLQKEFAEHLGRPVYYVPNGVDEQFYRRQRARRSEKLVAGWVGKPNLRKGLIIVREACEKAGVELKYVERNYKTALSSEEMREFYQDIHVLVVASDMDGTPNPALEAAACECVVVSNSIGNMPEFIDYGVNGFFVEREAASIAGALRELAADVPRAIEMGRAARATVDRDWTWAKMAQNYARMWRETVG